MFTGFTVTPVDLLIRERPTKMKHLSITHTLGILNLSLYLKSSIIRAIISSKYKSRCRHGDSNNKHSNRWVDCLWNIWINSQWIEIVDLF